jgi:hypothetical protein
MKKIENESLISLPSFKERDEIFYWLKRVSSITAWRRIFNYYSAWASATENSLRVADENGWGSQTSLPQSEYALILKCLAHCEEGVIRLSKGDKRVFKFDANGEFAMAARMMSHWTKMLERIRLGENVMRPHTPLWPEFCNALTQLAQTWGECGVYILESRFLEDPAPISYGSWLEEELKTMSFPKRLDSVPDPVENIFLRTGENTPYSGVWEPVKVPKRSLISLITGTPKPQPPFEIEGTMNYLHGGSKAPQAEVRAGDKSTVFNTTWRLIWADDRYIDGTIPDEEATYRFHKVDDGPMLTAVAFRQKEIVWAYSGSVAQITGRWLVESDLAVGIILRKGEMLPRHNGRDVRWVLAES